MLKLRGVKSPEEYKAAVSERAAKAKREKREQIRKDKETGVFGLKQAARDKINAQRKAAQTDFVNTVAEAMGWSHETTHPDFSNLPCFEAKKAASRHAAELLAKAKAAVNPQRVYGLSHNCRAARRALLRARRSVWGAGLDRAGILELAETPKQSITANMSRPRLIPMAVSNGWPVRGDAASRIG